MPEMADYSVVIAVFSIWLASRAEGVGMGWVSILDPLPMAEILDVPTDWRLIGYFCLGLSAGQTIARNLSASAGRNVSFRETSSFGDDCSRVRYWTK